ncbi:MAG TPA: hypothetical protein VNJ09_05820 [Chthonomonadales bacterium]|nr:hypothetical protein [Chthonomonadales bacterium]
MSRSKPVTRIALSVLISLGIIAGIYTSVQGSLLEAGVNAANVHVVNGLMTNLNHDRRSASELEKIEMQENLYSQPGGRGHGCEADMRIDPSD